MKKFLVYVLAATFVAGVFSSCAATKRDCNGIIKYKQKGGFYM